ncbi:hypothetical protein LTR49_028339 [Elasticomyces elasticus]|nr:hypothetical protein LTR49_028339 [Elasticomyces elasticus]
MRLTHAERSPTFNPSPSLKAPRATASSTDNNSCARPLDMMATMTPSNASDELHTILCRLCVSQTTLTQAVEELTRTVNTLAQPYTKLVSAQNENTIEPNVTTNVVAYTNRTQSTTNGDKNEIISSKDNRNLEASKAAAISRAGEHVTNAYELLEMVLLHLPMDTLLFSQRVNKQFQSTISDSKALQQKLFFSPLAGDLLVKSIESTLS